jgi:dipeptidase E
MRLLLTSCGVTNASIARAFLDIVGGTPREISLAFVPTAANAEGGDKGWLIQDLVNLTKLNLKSIDIVDISALGKRQWIPRMEKADVLYFGGGKRYHLMDWIKRSGLAGILRGLLRDRVFVGMSAGSMITGARLNLRTSHLLYGDDYDRRRDVKGLGYVDFSILPHLNNTYFPNLRPESIEQALRGTAETFYALDDSSALSVVDGKVTVVTEGTWKLFAPTSAR